MLKSLPIIAIALMSLAPQAQVTEETRPSRRPGTVFWERARNIDNADIKAAEYFMSLPEDERETERLVFYRDKKLYDLSLEGAAMWSSFDKEGYLRMMREGKGPIIAFHTHSKSGPLGEFPSEHEHPDDADLSFYGYLEFSSRSDGYRGDIQQRIIYLGGEKPVSIAFGLEKAVLDVLYGCASGGSTPLRTFNNMEAIDALSNGLPNIVKDLVGSNFHIAREVRYWVSDEYIKDRTNFFEVNCPEFKTHGDYSLCKLTVDDFSDHIYNQGKHYWVVRRGEIDLPVKAGKEK